MKYYIVSACSKFGAFENCESRPWFNSKHITPMNSWSSFVRCKTKAHALAQFRRLAKGAQIDIHGDGKSHVWRHK